MTKHKPFRYPRKDPAPERDEHCPWNAYLERKEAEWAEVAAEQAAEIVRAYRKGEKYLTDARAELFALGLRRSEVDALVKPGGDYEHAGVRYHECGRAYSPQGATYCWFCHCG